MPSIGQKNGMIFPYPPIIKRQRHRFNKNGTAIRRTAPRWSCYTVGDKSLFRHILKIKITLEM